MEGILPAPESSHAIRVAIDEAMKCKETGEEKTILFGLTGTGYFDMVAYEKFHNGQMTDYIPTDAELEASFAQLPKVPGSGVSQQSDSGGRSALRCFCLVPPHILRSVCRKLDRNHFVQTGGMSHVNPNRRGALALVSILHVPGAGRPVLPWGAGLPRPLRRRGGRGARRRRLGAVLPHGGGVPVGNATAEDLARYGAYYLGDTSKKVLYLTFDCGYENGHTEAILDALKKHDAPAAFFVVGHMVESAPDIVRRMAEEGHIVGNHTFHHPDMSAISDVESFRKELEDLETLYQETTGRELSKFYRPPRESTARKTWPRPGS